MILDHIDEEDKNSVTIRDLNKEIISYIRPIFSCI